MTWLDQYRVVPRIVALTLTGATVGVVWAMFDLAYQLVEHGEAATIAAILAPCGVLAAALAGASAKAAEYLGKREG